MIHTWERTWQYVKKAGTVILGISVLLWAAMTFPRLPDTLLETYDAQRHAILSAAEPAVIDALESVNEELSFSSDAARLRADLLSVDARQAKNALRHSLAGESAPGLNPSPVGPVLTGAPILLCWVGLPPRR